MVPLERPVDVGARIPRGLERVLTEGEEQRLLPGSVHVQLIPSIVRPLFSGRP
jgi:hypothetical protein